jgi:hypothetical protein
VQVPQQLANGMASWQPDMVPQAGSAPVTGDVDGEGELGLALCLIILGSSLQDTGRRLLLGQAGCLHINTMFPFTPCRESIYSRTGSRETDVGPLSLLELPRQSRVPSLAGIFC